MPSPSYLLQFHLVLSYLGSANHSPFTLPFIFSVLRSPNLLLKMGISCRDLRKAETVVDIELALLK